MRKRLIVILCAFLFLTTVTAASSNFNIDLGKALGDQTKTKKLENRFDSKYSVETDRVKTKDEDIIRELTKKTTYQLLGPANNQNESLESYIKRKKEFYDLRYAPPIPKDANGDLDRTSPEYANDVFTGMAIPGMFDIFGNLAIQYTEFGNIRVVEMEEGMVSLIHIPNVKMQISNPENPMEYKTITADLSITYWFKQYKGEYKLYYVMGEYDESAFNEYLSNQAKNEYNGTMSSSINYHSDFDSLYDFSKLKALPKDKIADIYNNNLSNILIFTTVYDKAISSIATGFFIREGVAVTTWSYLEQSLREGQLLTVKDGHGNVLTIEGVISVDVENDLAVFKIKGSKATGVKLGDSSKMEAEDPIIVISTKTSVSLSLQTGIVISNKAQLTNLVPITETETGSPIFNQNGEVIGMNVSQGANVSISKANSVKPLVSLQTIFSGMKLEDINHISFEELKDNYYIKYSENNVINTISKKAWSEYKKVGDIENTISMELIKASYKNNVVSLRYKNNLKNILPNMQFAGEFIRVLKNDGYKQVSDGAYKKVYKNNQYRVTIMSEFDYLIIVIAEV